MGLQRTVFPVIPLPYQGRKTGCQRIFPACPESGTVGAALFAAHFMGDPPAPFMMRILRTLPPDFFSGSGRNIFGMQHFIFSVMPAGRHLRMGLNQTVTAAHISAAAYRTPAACSSGLNLLFPFMPGRTDPPDFFIGFRPHILWSKRIVFLIIPFSRNFRLYSLQILPFCRPAAGAVGASPPQNTAIGYLSLPGMAFFTDPIGKAVVRTG